MKKRIIFYAPIGNLTQAFRSGGAEAGCKKTIEVLRKGGYFVILVEKPTSKSQNKLDKVILVIKLIKIWLKLVYLFLKYRKVYFHIAGFYLKQVYTEWFFLQTAAVLNIKTIYEIRNGGMIENYNNGSKLYQLFIRSIFLKASLVLCQGYQYVTFLKGNLNKDSVFYPNYIMDDFITDNNNHRENKKFIKFIYFGRVVPEKNIDFIFDVCKFVKNSNMEFSLDIIGSFKESYFQLLLKKAIENDVIKNITFHGRMEFKEIYIYLKEAHFFIFPSKEKREGHSNSLTEAMGCGVVPIVSRAGFNVEIVGNSKLVVENFSAEEYFNRIDEIWNKNTWKFYSDMVSKRIKENFTESIISKIILDAYDKLY